MVLFPHTTLSAGESRQLALFLPQLAILEVLQAPALPPWGRDHFLTLPVFTDTALRARARRLLDECRGFAELHRDGGLLTFLAQADGKDEAETSSFLLQTAVRGKGPEEEAVRAGRWLEAAVFLELARDLDEEEMELEGSFQRLGALEEEFRHIIGGSPEEELGADLGAVDIPLSPDRVRLSFMLARRARYWYRLMALTSASGTFTAVALSAEAIAEVLDPVETEWERSGKPFRPLQVALAALPSLDGLSDEDFLAVERRLHRAPPNLQRYWEALAAVVAAPADQRNHARAAAAGRALEEEVAALAAAHGGPTPGATTLQLVHLAGANHRDLWRHHDPAGAADTHDLSPGFDADLTLLYLDRGS
jgi:hypothetical protein